MVKPLDPTGYAVISVSDRIQKTPTPPQRKPIDTLFYLSKKFFRERIKMILEGVIALS